MPPWSHSLPSWLSHEDFQTAPLVRSEARSSQSAGTAQLILRGADERPDRTSLCVEFRPGSAAQQLPCAQGPSLSSALRLLWELRFPDCQGLLPPAAAGRLHARSWAWEWGCKNGKGTLCPSRWPQPGAVANPDLQCRHTPWTGSMETQRAAVGQVGAGPLPLGSARWPGRGAPLRPCPAPAPQPWLHFRASRCAWALCREQSAVSR